MMQRMVIRLRSENLDDIHSDLGVKIHGYIMSIIDSDYAEKLHTEALNPFSINVVRDGSELILTINALADEAMQIINALKAVDKIIVKGAPALKVLDYSIENPVGYKFFSKSYKIDPKKLTGMMGSVSFKIHGDYSNCELLKKLIHYSCYSGIGSRTALGMGGDEQNMLLV